MRISRPQDTNAARSDRQGQAIAFVFGLLVVLLVIAAIAGSSHPELLPWSSPLLQPR